MLVTKYLANLRGVLAVSMLTLAGSAFAQPIVWPRTYIGGYIGSGFASDTLSSNLGAITDTTYFSNSADLNSVEGSANANNSPINAIYGIQAGHDWIYKQMIYGVVADYGAFHFNPSNSVTTLYPDGTGAYTIENSMNTNWLFTLRGRWGYQATLHWPALFYFTGGMAVTQVNVTNRFLDQTSLLGIGGSSTSENQIGWTVGAGVELLAINNASVQLEYLYVRIPSAESTGVISNGQGGFGVPVLSLNSPFSTTAQLYANLVKLSVNYRFDA